MFRSVLPLFLTASLAGAAMPTLPSINTNNVFVVTNPTYGASTNSANNATAINNAITAASKASGGGTVEIPGPGTYLAGPITMKSKVNLQVDAGATLMMLPYGTWSGTTTFILGSSVSDVEISGSGTIDGQGLAWWNAYNADNSVGRPNFIEFSSTARLLIQNITLQNAPTFHIMLKSSKDNNITIQNLNINTPYPSPNTDGMDLGCTNMFIQNSRISDGDDNIEIGGSSDLAAWITVTNCNFGNGHGVSVGSDLGAGVHDLLVENCTFTNTDNAIRLKSDNDKGGVVQNLGYYNLVMSNIKYAPILIYSYYDTYGNPTIDGITPAVAAGTAVASVSSSTPVWRNIVISNVTATAGESGMIWSRTELPATNILLNKVNITASGAFDLYNVRNLSIVDSTINTKSYAMFNNQTVFSNSAPGAAAITLTGDSVTNSLAFDDQSASFSDSGLFGVTALTLNGSTLTDSTDLTLPSPTPVNFTLGTTPATIAINGAATLNNTQNIAAGSGFGPGTYTLYSYTSGSLSGTPVLGTKPSGYNYELTNDVTDQELNLVVISTNASSGKMLVTLPGQTYTSGSGNTGTVSPQAAGTQFHVTLTAVKSDGVTLDTSFTGTKTITFSGPGGSPSYPATVVFANGQNTSVPITLTLAQTTTLSAADTTDGYPAIASSSLLVNPGAVNSYVVSAGTSQSAGTAFTVTATARDANNNVVTTDSTDSVTLSGMGNATAAVNPVTLSSGVATFSVTDNTAETITITATDGNGKTGTSSSITVSPVLPDHFAISTISSPQTAGTAITGVTITAQNAANQTVTSFTGTVTYGGTAGITGTSAPFTAGVLSGVSVTPTVAGASLTFTVSASGKTGTATFNVNPGATDHYTVAAASTQTLGTAFPVTVTARDVNNNVVTTDNTDSVTLSGLGNATATVNPLTLTAGVATFSVTDNTAETITITATDGNNKTGTSGSIVIGATSVTLYRSTASGNWNAPATWQFSTNGGATWAGASAAPELSGVSAAAVYITNNANTGTPLAVTNTSTLTASNVVVYAGNTLATAGAVLTVAANPGQTNLDVFGTVVVNSSSVANAGTAGNVRFENGGTFIWNSSSAGNIPTASWLDGSTCEINNGASGTAPTGLNQSFYNFIWDWPGSGQCSLNAQLTTVRNDLTMTGAANSTNSVRFLATGVTCNLSIGRDFTVAGGVVTLSGGSAANTILNLSVGRNLTIAGGANLDSRQGNATTGAGSYVDISFTNTAVAHTLSIAGSILHDGAALGCPINWIIATNCSLTLIGNLPLGDADFNTADSVTVNGTLNLNGSQIAGNQGGVNMGTLTMDGTVEGNGTNQLAVALNTVNYGGTLNLGALPALAPGQSFVLFGATNYSGAFGAIVPSTPGAGLVWNTSNLTTNGSLAVTGGAGGMITISGHSLSGTNFVISGNAGIANANGTYTVLASTNLASQWTPLTTNTFDASGNFAATNSLGASPQMFFRLLLP